MHIVSVENSLANLVCIVNAKCFVYEHCYHSTSVLPDFLNLGKNLKNSLTL